MSEVVYEYESEGHAFEFSIRNSICRMILWILRYNQEKNNSLTSSRARSRIDINTLNRIFEFVDRSYNQEITTEAVAKMCNYSCSYFSTEFKKASGMGFKEYLNLIRITQGEKLLLTTNKSITEISQNLGYTTASYFIQQFKKVKKLSPKQYRKKSYGYKTGFDEIIKA